MFCQEGTDTWLYTQMPWGADYSSGLRESSSHQGNHAGCHSYENSQETATPPNHSQDDLGWEKGRKQLGRADGTCNRREETGSSCKGSHCHLITHSAGQTGPQDPSSPQLSEQNPTSWPWFKKKKSPTGPGPMLSHLSPLFALPQPYGLPLPLTNQNTFPQGPPTSVLEDGH